MRKLTLLFLVGCAFAESPSLTDNLRVDIAIAQRDYLIAQSRLEAAKKRLYDLNQQATAVCTNTSKSFDEISIACVERPAQK